MLERPEHNPMVPLMVAGLVAMAVIVVLSVVVWAWAVRRPAVEAAPATLPTPTEEAMQPTATSSATPQSKPIVYAAIGASDVVGVGADNPATQSWINILHGKMPEETKLVRLGRSGITLAEANKVEVPAAVEAQPDVVTLWNTVNDATRGVTVTTYISQLKSALNRLTGETHAQIVVLNLPDITVLMNGMPTAQRDMIRGGVQQWNKAMAETVASYGPKVHFVDLYPVSEEILQHPEYISGDNFHPSTTGYERLAGVVWDVIQREGVLKQP